MTENCNPVFGIYGYSPGTGLTNYCAENCSKAPHTEIRCYSVPGVGHNFYGSCKLVNKRIILLLS